MGSITIQWKGRNHQFTPLLDMYPSGHMGAIALDKEKFIAFLESEGLTMKTVNHPIWGEQLNNFVCIPPSEVENLQAGGFAAAAQFANRQHQN